MRFTLNQYDAAIEALQAAKKQLLEGTQDQGCGVCGGCCHPDMCKFNPMYAQYLCVQISTQSTELHDTLHYMAGFETLMGECVGPAKVVIGDKP